MSKFNRIVLICVVITMLFLPKWQSSVVQYILLITLIFEYIDFRRWEKGRIVHEKKYDMHTYETTLKKWLLIHPQPAGLGDHVLVREYGFMCFLRKPILKHYASFPGLIDHIRSQSGSSGPHNDDPGGGPDGGKPVSEPESSDHGSAKVVPLRTGSGS